MKYTKAWYVGNARSVINHEPGVDLLLLALEREADVIHSEAMKLVDSYHEHRRECIDRLPKRDRGYLSCRVQQKDLGIRITWMIQHPVPKRRRSLSGNTVLSEAINKPKSTNTYTRSRVITKLTKPYEAQLFDYYEPKFAHIRAKSKKLGEILRACGYYRKHYSAKGVLRDERYYEEE